MRSLVALALLLSLPSITVAASPISLYRLPCNDHETIERLLDAGVLVSQRLELSSLAFGDLQTRRLLEEVGCPFEVLEEDVEDREHYVIEVPSEVLHDLPASMVLLYTEGRAAIVSIPAGRVADLIDSRLEFVRLFRTPMHLPAQPPRLWSKAHSQTTSSEWIRGLVEQVSGDSLFGYVFTLEAFQSRHATHVGGRAAAKWIEEKLRSFGYADVEIHAWSSLYWGNVVATLRGTTLPDEIIVIGGHYDSVVPDSDDAPGADDNASGTAAMLECARILAASHPARTIRFIAFGAEELGLLGSDAYAYRSFIRGDHILAMLNLDMLGYLSEKDEMDLDIIFNLQSLWLREAVEQVAKQYVSDLPIVSTKLISGSSDHASFWRHGYDAIFFFEDGQSSSPFIHTVDDIVGLSYNNNRMHTLCTQTALALLVTLADEPDVPVALESFAARVEAGQVHLSWRSAPRVVQQLLGIHVQQSGHPEGPYLRRTPTLLPSDTSSYCDRTHPMGASWYRLELIAEDGTSDVTIPLQVSAGTEDQTNLESVVTDSGTIQIRYRIGTNATSLKLSIFDIRGRLVRTLVRAEQPTGTYLLTWDRSNDRGGQVANGLYVVQLRTASASLAKKLVVLNP